MAAPDLPPTGTPAPAGTPSLARVVALYHRALNAAYHGSSLHFRGFVEGLRRVVPVEVVAPGERATVGTDRARESSGPLLVGFRYLLAAVAEELRFIVRDARSPRAQRARVIVPVDVYVAGLAAVWSWIRQVPLVYYPLDANTAVSRHWRKAGYRGGILFGLTRRPLNALGLRIARIVIAPSEEVARSLREGGVPAEKLRVCTLKRTRPVPDPVAIARWRAELGLAGRVPAVFVGSFQYAPNVRAFHFLRDELAPALGRSDPDLLILVGGLDSEPYVPQSGANLRVLGTVSDLDGLLFACEIGLAPMDVAGGTSGKMVDYVLHGLRVLATPEAAAGIDAAASVQVAPCSEFADRLKALCAEVRASRGPALPPRPDPEFVRRYTESADLDRVAQEIASLARS